MMRTTGKFLILLALLGIAVGCGSTGGKGVANEKNEVVAQLGADVKRVTTGNNIRGDASQWIDGKFVHPHDACFDNDGNIFVAEWVATGRVSKLKRLA